MKDILLFIYSLICILQIVFILYSIVTNNTGIKPNIVILIGSSILCISSFLLGKTTFGIIWLVMAIGYLGVIHLYKQDLKTKYYINQIKKLGIKK